jgi:hypothetical protein
MKIVSLINQNIPIWSMLCGDHALRSVIDTINPKLLKNPDFLSPLENQLRLEVFKDKREWIYEKMKDRASFALVQVSLDELLEYNTCFTGVSFKNFVNKYRRASKQKSGFSIKRPRHKTDLTKKKSSVEQVASTLVNKLNEHATNRIGELSHLDVLDTNQKNEEDIFLASNRGFLMKSKDGSTTIMDGTHRLTAYALAQGKKSSFLPHRLFAFYWREV